MARHLFEKRDYSYALFFGHLTVEKVLKAAVVARTGKQPPMTHRLTQMAEVAGLEVLAWFLGCFGRAIAASEQRLVVVLDKTRFWRRHAGLPRDSGPADARYSGEAAGRGPECEL